VQPPPPAQPPPATLTTGKLFFHHQLRSDFPRHPSGAKQGEGIDHSLIPPAF